MRRRHLAWPLVALTAALAVAPAGGARAAGTPAGGEPAALILVEQTPVVEPGGTFAVRFRLDGVPADGSLQVVVHQRVRSRSELALSMEGEGLRSEVLRTVVALEGLAPDGDGVRELSLSLDPDLGVLPIRTEGVYPVELIAQDVATDPVARVVTHLVLGPDEADDAPSLGVAVVASLRAPPALQPDGSVRVPGGRLDDLAAMAEGLAGSTTPATLDVVGETLDALRAEGTGDPSVVTDLTEAARGRSLLAGTYVDVSPDALAAADLLDELGPQLAAGEEAVRDLGPTPSRAAALAPDDLGRAGLEGLLFTGVTTVVVDPSQVEPLDPGLIPYSLAQPVVVTAPDSGATVTALVTDPTLEERLGGEGSPGLVASRVLSELALLRLEQPSRARSVVLVLRPGMDAEAISLLLDGVGAGRPFEPVDLPGAVDHADPLLDGGGAPVELALLPADVPALPAELAERLRAGRDALTTFAGLVGEDPDLLEPLERHLLVAEALGMTAAQRRAHLDHVGSTIAGIQAQVTTPPTFTLTLTARDGTIPLTIGNGTDLPLHVTVRLRSQKLEFPEGDTIDLVLDETNTRLDIPVRALASGAFPLQIEVTTPDGRQRLSMSRFTVRSTAVSGAGLVLSIGAGAFLVVWWARHWHRTRRSAKLVASGSHPASGP